MCMFNICSFILEIWGDFKPLRDICGIYILLYPSILYKFDLCSLLCG